MAYSGGYPAHPNEIHSSPVHALIAQLRAERDEAIDCLMSNNAGKTDAFLARLRPAPNGGRPE
jgi:hypothetical protein